ncbi:hypothetical protein IWW36_004935, partial [Coemansia brasiliensis]
MARSGKATSSKTGGRGKGRAPAKLQKPKAKRAKTPVDSFEIYDASAGVSEKEDRRHRNLENVDVRDYEVDEIDSEDDEEIDSDAAFDESDEERFSNFQQFFNKKEAKSQHKVRFADEDDSDIEEDEEEGDLVDLSEMLDHNATDQEEEKEEKSKAQSSDSEDLSGFGSSDSEDSDDQEDSEDEQTRLSRLNGFVSSISARAPKKRFISEAGDQAENEHAVGSGMHARGVSLGLSDLLGTTTATTDQSDIAGGEDQASRSVRLLREQVHKMEHEARRAGSGVVAAPIARRLQDQMDRTVAYAQTKKSVSEWQPTVNEMRAAEHISFPLNETKQ